jgi:hypothetical protein
MHPEIHLNYWAVLAAVAASFVFGWIWHGPLFGKLWVRLMKLPANFQPTPKAMLRSMALGVFGTVLTAYVLTYTGAIWRASVWGVGTDAEFYFYGFMAGFFTWLGFYVPLFLNAVAWEGRSWGLFGLNVAYHFFNLQIIAMILAYWR